MDEELLISSGIQSDAAEEMMRRRKVGKINIDDDSMINELNFCYPDPVTTAMT